MLVMVCGTPETIYDIPHLRVYILSYSRRVDSTLQLPNLELRVCVASCLGRLDVGRPRGVRGTQARNGCVLAALFIARRSSIS